MTWLDFILGFACLCGGVSLGVSITTLVYNQVLKEHGLILIEEDENDK